MTTTKKMMMLAVMAAFAGTMSAQVVAEQPDSQEPATAAAVDAQSRKVLSNAELSEQYKLEIVVLNNEIKTLKSKAKLYKADSVKSAAVATELATKKAELSEVKTKKNIVDKALKTEKASKKATEKAEKAKKKAEAAAAKAATLQ